MLNDLFMGTSMPAHKITIPVLVFKTENSVYCAVAVVSDVDSHGMNCREYVPSNFIKCEDDCLKHVNRKLKRLEKPEFAERRMRILTCSQNLSFRDKVRHADFIIYEIRRRFGVSSTYMPPIRFATIEFD